MSVFPSKMSQPDVSGALDLSHRQARLLLALLNLAGVACSLILVNANAVVMAAAPDSTEIAVQEPEDPDEPVDPDDPFAEPDPQDSDDPFAESDPEEPEDPPAEAEEPQEPDVPDLVEPDSKPMDEPKAEGDSAPKEPMVSPEGTDSTPGSQTKPDAVPPEGSDSKPVTDLAPAEGSGTTNPASSGQDLAFERLRNMIQEAQSNEAEINQLVISMPVGFPDKRKQHQARLELLRARNLAIVDELGPAALESFEKFPNTQPMVTNYLLQQMKLQLTGQNFRRAPFDPVGAMQSYKRLVDGGVKVPIIHLYGYRVHYLLNDFDSSLASLKQAAAEGQKVETAVVKDLQHVMEVWKKETELRRQDAEKKNPRVEIEMDCGKMVVELYEDQAPNTVANFITLAEDGFYNGLEFYLVNPVEVAVAGSPTNNGQGGPGYSIQQETADKNNMRHHFAGVLSMMPISQNVVSSQFLITKQPMLKFDGQISAFGRVIEGLGSLYKIQVINRTVTVPAGEELAATRIIKMTVLQKRDHDYIPQKMVADATPLPGG